MGKPTRVSRSRSFPIERAEDVERAPDTVRSDRRERYFIGYSPSHAALDLTWQQIEVRTPTDGTASARGRATSPRRPRIDQRRPDPSSALRSPASRHRRAASSRCSSLNAVRPAPARTAAKGPHLAPGEESCAALRLAPALAHGRTRPRPPGPAPGAPTACRPVRCCRGRRGCARRARTPGRSPPTRRLVEAARIADAVQPGAHLREQPRE